MTQPDLSYIHPDLRALALPLDSLTPDPRNARKHSATNLEAIRVSLVRWGMREPIVVQRGSNGSMIIRAGNGRTQVARELGWTHLPAIVVDEGDTEAIAFALADNRTAELAEWDPEVLGGLLVDLQATGMDLGAMSLDWALDEPDDAPEDQGPAAKGGPAGSEPRVAGEVHALPVTQPGDLWVLGPHRLLCGDSFDPDARARLMEGRLADMALMDPPFAIYGSSTGVGSDIADDKMIQPFFRDLGQAIIRSIREFAHVYVCCDWRSWSSVWAGMTAAKLSPKNMLVWDKGDGGLGANYQQCHELLGFFARLPPLTAMQTSAALGQRIVQGKPNIVRYSRPTGDQRLHNAAKPVPMMSHLIENSSDPGELVLDLFNGSGTVIMACQQTGRVGRAMELEPTACDITVARWEKATGQVAARVRPAP